MTIAVLIHEDIHHVTEIELDINPAKNEVFKVLGGPPTFIGQWPVIDVVIMKSTITETTNSNSLPKPFHKEDLMGKILLIRMDTDSEPQDFTLEEYLQFIKETSSE